MSRLIVNFVVWHKKESDCKLSSVFSVGKAHLLVDQQSNSRPCLRTPFVDSTQFVSSSNILRNFQPLCYETHKQLSPGLKSQWKQAWPILNDQLHNQLAIATI